MNGALIFGREIGVLPTSQTLMYRRGITPPEEVRRLAIEAQWAAQTRRWRHQQDESAHHTPDSPSSSSSSSSPSSPVHGSACAASSFTAASKVASQLSSLRRLSACTVSLSRKPADGLQSSRASRSCRYATDRHSEDEHIEEDSACDDSEYRLSDDSSLSSRSSRSSSASSSSSSSSGFSSDSADSPNPSESPRARQRRLHRLRQARYAARKRRCRRLDGQVLAKDTPSVVAPVMAKRRLSSSAHISPALRPVLKARVVEPEQPVPAIVVKALTKHEQKHSDTDSLCTQQALLMSPLSLGMPASLVTAVSKPSLSSSRTSSLFSTTSEPFLNVSVDVFYVVLSFLHPIDLLRLCAVSSAANQSTSDSSVWRPLVHRTWPISCDHPHDWKRVYCTRIKRALAGAHYFCTFCACTRTFKQDGMLDAHTAKHSQQQTVYPCTVPGCGLSFDTARKLQYHVKRHNGSTVAKRHACDWSGCTLTFPTPYALSLHRCRHTGKQRPHVCKHVDCHRSFNSRHALTLHLDTHNPKHERTLTFPCTVYGCDRTFMTKSGLGKHHVKVHGEVRVGGRPAVRLLCEVEGCGRVYHYRSELRKHMKKRHKWVEVGEEGEKVKEKGKRK